MLSRTFAIGGVMLGAGLAGLFDGIVFHQILGWHHLICITEHCRPRSIEHLERQNTQDGFFHLAVYLLTLAGSYLVFLAASRSQRRLSSTLFFGVLLCGAGFFNFAEGVTNHHVLGIHHVAPGSPYQLHADIAFTASGLIMLAAGWMLVRSSRVTAGSMRFIPPDSAEN